MLNERVCINGSKNTRPKHGGIARLSYLKNHGNCLTKYRSAFSRYSALLSPTVEGGGAGELNVSIFMDNGLPSFNRKTSRLTDNFLAFQMLYKHMLVSSAMLQNYTFRPHFSDIRPHLCHFEQTLLYKVLCNRKTR